VTTHDSAARAFAPSELPCDDPSCDADPGELSGAFWAVGDAGVPSRGDLVRVARSLFAVKDCPRCGGTGKNAAASHDTGACRCLVDSLGALELRADELHERAREIATSDPQMAQGLWLLAQRCDSAALAAALRERLLPAGVLDHSVAGPVAVVITRFGIVVLRHQRGQSQVLVRRTDGTDWLLSTDGSARGAAAAVGSTVPELAHEGSHLLWLVAQVTVGDSRPRFTVVWASLAPVPGQPCRHCAATHIADRCPSLRIHMMRAVERSQRPPTITVFGAFPVATDVAPGHVIPDEVIDEAVATTVRLIQDGRLTIT